MIDEDETFDRLVAAARAQLAAGVSLEEIMAFLRREGLWQLQSIKVLRWATGVGLAEAKHLIHTSATWADQRRAADELHEVLTQAITDLVDSIDADGCVDLTDYQTGPDLVGS
ncbi:hypothetical protein HC031_15710 [Planosporangium thailandense]|uniref:Uncharacterized protein n=1 Tax=Planosporangium thailandense TaxID=765197 RepID=A0ABX0XYL5_9ACTN|nr:hypothetical protein [Planosporangium thailandense]NJC71147.1 hypothetical protein [Planosporangium thailandense]